MTKILWHSVAPWCPSGYGQQTHLFTKRLQQLGHDVTVSSWFGLNDQAIEYDGIRVLPGDQKFGNVILPEYVRAIKPDLVIALMDAWVLNTDMCRDMPMAVWVPVDHQPCPPKVAEFFHLTGSTPIAMSRSGEQLLRDEGLNPLYVPHGIDTNVYKPTNRAEVREAMRVSESEFLVGVVASNSGGIDGRASRKSFPQMFLAFADFHANHPNAKLYLHTETTGEPGLADGLPLGYMLNRFGIPLDAVKVASRMDMKIGVSPAKMAGLYSAFDVLLNPSMGEGFGIPIVEAQACFPAGTDVEVIDPIATHTKSYTGRMVTLTTGRGSFEATEDHPIWTADGWRSAGSIQCGDQILYCVDAAEGLEQVHTGPIDAVVDALQDDAVERGCGFVGDVLQRGVLASPEAGVNWEAVFRNRAIASGGVVRQSASLPGGAGGRRRNGDDSKSEPWQGAEPGDEALCDRLEYGSSIDGVAAFCNPDSIGVRGSAKDTIPSDVLSVLGRGARISSVVYGAGTVVGAKGRSDALGHRMDNRAFISIQDRPLDPAAARDRLADPRSQFDTVSAVSERYVRDLPVYNVTTKSSTYRVGPGYLVHNCGTPVITTQWTSMPELTAAGWCVGGEVWYDTRHGAGDSFFMNPNIEAISRALEQAYEMKDDRELRDRAREFALGYDADRVLEEFWKPALEALNRPREVPPLNRAARRAKGRDKVTA